jgi:hypothetical protein
MVLFYSQGDQDIYDEGDHFIPQEQYRLGKFSNTVAPMPMDSTQQVTQEFGIPYTGAFTGEGGGGGGLGGKFGNLDESDWKMIDKNVWEVGGPANMYGSWVNKPVKGYYDPQTKTYKTWEGKNIDHAGLFTGDPKEGDIEGTPTKIPSMFGILKKLREKIASGKEKLGEFIGGKDEIITEKISEGDKEGMNQVGSPPGGDATWKGADGGRIGFEEGGWSPGVGRDEQGYQSDHPSFEGGQGDGNNQNNFTLDSNLISTQPFVEATYSPFELATLKARLYNKNLLTDDDIGLEGQLAGGNNLIDYGIDFTGEGITGSNVGIGPLNVYMDPHKNIENISFDQDIGNWNVQGGTDLDRHGLGLNYSSDNNPFFFRGDIDNMGNRNVMGGVKWEWGQPNQPGKTLSYDDLIYGLKYGGLVGIL